MAIFPTDPLERVREGMLVVDATGDRPIGRVVRIQAAVRKAASPPEGDAIEEMVDVVPAPPDMSEAGAEFDVVGPSPLGHDPVGLGDVPEPLRRHLEQVGFIEIESDAKLPDSARLIAADRIDDISGDRVVVRLPG